MRTLSATLLMLSALFSGCSSRSIVRDAKTYEMELRWFTEVSLREANHLEGFIQSHCTCNAQGVFTEDSCRKAAKDLLVVRARVPYHRNLALFNAGILDVRPSETAPNVPSPSTLCPGGK